MSEKSEKFAEAFRKSSSYSLGYLWSIKDDNFPPMSADDMIEKLEKTQGESMALTFTIPDYSEMEEKLKELEERLDRQNQININFKEGQLLAAESTREELKDLQYQNGRLRKHLSDMATLMNSLSYKVNCLENDEEDEESDEDATIEQLGDKIDEFVEAMKTLKNVLLRD